MSFEQTPHQLIDHGEEICNLIYAAFGMEFNLYTKMEIDPNKYYFTSFKITQAMSYHKFIYQYLQPSLEAIKVNVRSQGPTDRPLALYVRCRQTEDAWIYDINLYEVLT